MILFNNEEIEAVVLSLTSENGVGYIKLKLSTEEAVSIIRKLSCRVDAVAVIDPKNNWKGDFKVAYEYKDGYHYAILNSINASFVIS